MKQTNKTNKLDICNICLSVPVGLAQPSEAPLERPWVRGSQGDAPSQSSVRMASHAVVFSLLFIFSFPPLFLKFQFPLP